jgi:hypothetical protein
MHFNFPLNAFLVAPRLVGLFQHFLIGHRLQRRNIEKE